MVTHWNIIIFYCYLLLPLTEKATTKGDIVHKTQRCNAMEYENIEISVILD